MTTRIAEVTGAFSGTGGGTAVQVQGLFNVLATGASGVVQLERSFDGGATWVACNLDAAGTPAAWTLASTAPLNATWYEPEAGVLYRLNCTTYSAAITYRLSK